jgi:hypothetical protein
MPGRGAYAPARPPPITHTHTHARTWPQGSHTFGGTELAGGVGQVHSCSAVRQLGLRVRTASRNATSLLTAFTGVCVCVCVCAVFGGGGDTGVALMVRVHPQLRCGCATARLGCRGAAPACHARRCCPTSQQPPHSCWGRCRPVQGVGSAPAARAHTAAPPSSRGRALPLPSASTARPAGVWWVPPFQRCAAE